MMFKLKELREAKGISQKKLADTFGVARSTIAMWESESSQPDNTILIKLANFFDVTTDYLLGWDSQNEPQITGAAAHLPAGLPKEALEEYRQMLEFLKFKYSKEE